MGDLFPTVEAWDLIDQPSSLAWDTYDPGADTTYESRHAALTLMAGSEPVPGYRLVAWLGRGGSAEVWRAVGPSGFPLALKFIRLGGADETAQLRSLEYMKEIRHAHLLAFFGAWLGDGLLIVGMELAEQTLLDRLDEVRRSGLPGIPFPELIELMHQAARGIDFLNRPRHAVLGREGVGIQHRDIKPQNLFLVGGSLKVGDFGLAKVLEESHTSNTGSMTLAYAPPELFHGQVSGRSDQYSLAVTYCHLRAGVLPFSGNPAAMATGHLFRAPDLAALPPNERPAVARALSKRPEDRWPDCESFVDELAASQNVAGRRSGIRPARMALATVGRRPGRWPALAAGVLLPLAGVAVAVLPPARRGAERTSEGLGGATIASRMSGRPAGTRPPSRPGPQEFADQRSGGRDPRRTPPAPAVVEEATASAPRPDRRVTPAEDRELPKSDPELVVATRAADAGAPAPSEVYKAASEWAKMRLDLVARSLLKAIALRRSDAGPPRAEMAAAPEEASNREIRVALEREGGDETPPVAPEKPDLTKSTDAAAVPGGRGGASPVDRPEPRTSTIIALLPTSNSELVVRGEVGRGHPDEWYGARRVIHTPPIVGNKEYLIGAFWTDARGVQATRQKELAVEPGKTYEVDLRASKPTWRVVPR